MSRMSSAIAVEAEKIDVICGEGAVADFRGLELVVMATLFCVEGGVSSLRLKRLPKRNRHREEGSEVLLASTGPWAPSRRRLRRFARTYVAPSGHTVLFSSLQSCFPRERSSQIQNHGVTAAKRFARKCDHFLGIVRSTTVHIDRKNFSARHVRLHVAAGCVRRQMR